MGGGAGADVPRLSAKRGPTVTPETGGVRHDGPPSGSWLAKIATSSSRAVSEQAAKADELVDWLPTKTPSR
jgi:hypothetical protein